MRDLRTLFYEHFIGSTLQLAVKALCAAVESATYEEGVKVERDCFITLNESGPAAALQYVFFSESDLPKVICFYRFYRIDHQNFSFSSGEN